MTEGLIKVIIMTGLNVYSVLRLLDLHRVVGGKAMLYGCLVYGRVADKVGGVGVLRSNVNVLRGGSRGSYCACWSCSFLKSSIQRSL